MLFSLRPNRDNNKAAQAHVVADIDAIDVKPVAFKWADKIHVLRPITTKEYLKVTETFAKMERLSKEGGYTCDELVDVYAELLASLCDTITRADIMRMTQAQVGAVLQLIIDHVTGRVEKKKMTAPQPQVEETSQSKP